MPYPVSAVRNKGGAAPVAPPAQPTGLSATPVSTSQIDLAWTDVATTETAYRVYRSTDGVNYAQVGTDLAAGTQTYSDTTPTSGTTYYYKVAAVNAGGETLSDADSTNTLMYGLVMALNLNEVSGNRADDTGRGNTAVLTGTVGNDTGILGNAAKSAAWGLNYLTVTYGTDLALGDVDWTISVWIYMPALTGYPTVLAQQTAGGTDWNLWLDSDVNKFKFQSGASTAMSTVVCSINTWYNVRFGYKAATDKIQISVNNETTVEAAKVGGITDNSRALSIGRAYAGAGANNNTRFDRLYRWTRLLTATEMTADYNGGAPFALPF